MCRLSATDPLSPICQLKKRRANAPEPRKLLGHGIVDNLSRSLTLSRSTADATLVYSECLNLYSRLGVPIEEVRGIGIQLRNLEATGPARLTTEKTRTTLLREGRSESLQLGKN